ncbi:MAG: sugar nucleotide-binding protein, partial [Planctomycetes bacterium]|nr:sugar nucleotide-binding protein [Planctomycetota bacterium]
PLHCKYQPEKVNAAVFFLSTDYVFDGSKSKPYLETDSPHPLSVYGRSKLEAEEALKSKNVPAYLVRTSWLYGDGGKNFFRAILRRLSRGELLRVVSDQYGAPTYTRDLADAISKIIDAINPKHSAKEMKTYHIANSGRTTWWGAAQRVIHKINNQTNVNPISSQELNRIAKRPRNSVFDMSRVTRDFGIEMRSWEAAVDDYWSRSLVKEWEQLAISN